MTYRSRDEILHTPVQPLPTLEDKPGIFDFDGDFADAGKDFIESFAESNIPVSIVQKMAGTHYTDDILRARVAGQAQDTLGGFSPDWTVEKDPYIMALPPDWMKFAYDVEGPNEAFQMWKAVQKREEEKKLRAERGGVQMLGAIAGELTNPGAVFSFRKIDSLKDVLLGSTAIAGDELALQMLQPERSSVESAAAVTAFAVGAGAIVGYKSTIKALRNRRYSTPESDIEDISGVMANEMKASAAAAATTEDIFVGGRNINEDILAKERDLLEEDFFDGPDGVQIRDEPDPVPDTVAPERAGIAGEELEPALGLERMPDSPIKDVLARGSDLGKAVIAMLVENPFFQKKNAATKEASLVGIDRKVAINWVAPMVDAMRETEQAWLRYRQRMSNSTSTTVLGQQINDVARGRNGAMSFSEFLDAVGAAKQRIGREGADAIDEDVMAAANVWHNKVYKPMGEAAKKNGMFSQALRRELWELRDQVRNGAELTDELKGKIKDLRKQIKEADNAELDPGFLNRIYRKDMIRARKDEFIDLLVQNGRSMKDAKGITEAILRGTPRIADEDFFGPAEEMFTGRASSLRERSLGDIPNEAFGDFLESNIFALGKYYTTRVGPDVELTKQFGSIDLHRQLYEIKARWDMAIDRARAVDRPKMIKRRDAEIENIRVVRDRIRGTYGLPDDPDTWSNRGLRLAKMWNATTMLTGAIAAVPDMGRIIMYDGMTRAFGHAFDVLNGNLGTLKMAKAEAQLAGEALDMYLSMRAAIFADLSDAMSATTQFEHMAAKATQQFFNFSLMNPWNVGVKTMASLITGSRIIDEATKWSAPLRNSAKAQVVYEQVAARADRIAASYNKAANKVTIDLDLLREKWGEKAWTRPRLEGVEPLPENQFKTFEEFRDFVIEHELAHSDFRPKRGETRGQYEDRINKVALKRVGSRGSVSADFEQTKLARSGIDINMAARISAQFEQFGVRNGNVRIAKTADWTDKEAAKAYRAALGKEINTIIVTPGAGDLPHFMGGGFEVWTKERKKARKQKQARGEELSRMEKAEDLFMSPQMAQLLLQFKTFGAAATQRVLVPGLQHPDKRFLLGAAGLVAMGVMLDQVRDWQNDYHRPKSTGERLRGGIERSGVLGWFADANGAIETLTDGRFGIGPLLGDSPHEVSLARKLGTVGGPIVSQGRNASRLLFGLSDGDVGHWDAKYLGNMLPGNRVFWADGLFDFTEDAIAGAF